jgi:hypothetical protein
MDLRGRLRTLERQRDRRHGGACPHGVDIIESHEPDRPAPRCDRCGLLKLQIAFREDESGLPFAPERRGARGNERYGPSEKV